MNPYRAYFQLSMKNELQYRVAAYAGVATQFFWGFVYLMIFHAFYQHTDHNLSMTFDQLTDYIWLQQAFLAFIMTWYRDPELFKLITSGNLAYELCRPISLYHFWFAKLTAKRLSAGLLRCFPILIVALFLPEPYRLALPANLSSSILFFIALALGLLIMVSLSMFVYLTTMKTLSPTGALLIFSIGGDFMSGTLLPLPLMPDQLRTVLEYLPFRYTADFAFRVYSGHIAPSSAIVGIVAQVFWLGILTTIGRVWMSRALKSVTVQGG